MLWAESNFIGFGFDLFSVYHHSTDCWFWYPLMVTKCRI